MSNLFVNKVQLQEAIKVHETAMKVSLQHGFFSAFEFSLAQFFAIRVQCRYHSSLQSECISSLLQALQSECISFLAQFFAIRLHRVVIQSECISSLTQLFAIRMLVIMTRVPFLTVNLSLQDLADAERQLLKLQAAEVILRCSHKRVLFPVVFSSAP